MGRPKGSKNKTKSTIGAKSKSSSSESKKYQRSAGARSDKTEDIHSEKVEKKNTYNPMRSADECFLDAARAVTASGRKVDMVAPKQREFTIWNGKTVAYKSPYEIEINGVRFWLNGCIFMCDKVDYDHRSKKAPYGYDTPAMAAAMISYSRSSKPRQNLDRSSRLLNSIICRS